MKKESYLKSLFLISLPVIFQNLLSNSLSFIDTLMIGQLGEIEIAAVGLAGQYYFIFFVVTFGISGGISIFTSQFWGSQNMESFQKGMGVGLSVSVGISVLFSAFSLFAPELILHLFVDDLTVISIGSEYLRWVGVSYVFVAVSQVLSIALRSTGDTKNPMYVTFLSMLIDVVGNYFLIFKAGWGASGAAIATLFARLVEMVVLLFIIYRSPAKPIFSKMFKFNGKFVVELMKTVFPVMLNDASWALGMTVYKAVYSKMGVDVLASSNISGSIQDLFFVIGNGLGAGIGIILGNKIGKGQIEEVRKNANVSLLIACSAGCFSGILLFLSSGLIPNLFNTGNAVREMTRLTIVIISTLLPIKYMNHAMICGILRSGGDTRFVLRTEVFTIWGVGVPLVFFAGLKWGCPIHFVFLIAGCEELVKVILCIPRVLSGKWVTDFSKY